MRSILAFALVAGLLFSVAGCAITGEKPFNIDSIASYREIPGVTEEEIRAIEALKSARAAFSYGQMLETEAFILPDGTFAGFTTKLCGLFSELFGISFVQEFYEWEDLKEGLDSGRIDFTGDLTANPERMHSYFMTHPIAERSQKIFMRTDRKLPASEKEIDGLKVGFLKDSIDAETLRRSYPELRFEAVSVDNLSTAAERLWSGAIDAFVCEGVADPFFEGYGDLHSRDFLGLAYTPVSLATANPGLEPVISVVNKYVLAGGIDKLYELYREGNREYARYKLNKSFTPEELQYLGGKIARNEKIPLAVEHENYPVSFYNVAEREFQGFATDIIKEISDLTGLEFRAVTAKDTDWEQILEMLRSGEASMITQLLYSDARRDDYIWNTVPYAASHYALLSKQELPDMANYQVLRARVGIIEGSGHADLYYATFPDADNVVFYSSHEEALIALEEEEIDLLMASEYTLLHQTNFREKPGFKENIRFGTPMTSQFGFNKNEEMLRAIVDKTLLYINTDSIVRSWTGRIFDYSRKYAIQFSKLLSFFVLLLSFALTLALRMWRRSNRFRQDLERKTATLSSVFTTIPDMLYSKDANLKYTSCNPSFELLAGCKEAKLIGKSAAEVFVNDQEMARGFAATDEKVMRERTIQTAEHWFVFPDGSRRLFESLKAPLTQNGVFVGVMGISRDITEHRKAEDAARAASKAKSAFLAHMSHEIRTPMNAISGMTELILREEIPQSIQEYMLGIKHASANLLSLINDVLDFSKIEAGSMEIVPTDYLFTSLINDVLMMVRMKISEKPVSFTANIDSTIPNHLIGDETRIRQILLNVLGNAAQYTYEGFVSLNVTGSVENERTVILKLEVADSGVGIKPRDVEKLFGDFVRFDGVKNKGIQGTGLGLAITKKLCQAMGGDITVQSEYGVGSTFTITVAQKCLYREGPFAYVSDPEEKRVLIYETRVLYADSVARSLADLGVPCAVASDKPDFLAKLKDCEYRFIFASYLLSESASRTIAELGLGAKLVLLAEFWETPVMEDVRTIAMPVHAASIANVLNDTEGNARHRERGQEKARFIAPSASVLVVDDVNTNLKVAEGLMMPYQMRVDVCGSGAEAIRRVSRNRYDVIFMDHMMPEMDGLEATKRIRALEDDYGYYKEVPIIALTANAIAGAKDVFLRNGMNDFLAKPIEIAKLNSMLDKWIPKDKKERYKETGGDAPGKPEDTRIRIEGIDVAAGVTMTGGLVENYLKTLAIFHMDGHEKIAKIRECMQKNDIKLYTTYVHALKSAVASIGAKELSDFAKALEMAGMRGDTALIEDNTERFLTELEAILENIHAALSREQALPAAWNAPVSVMEEVLKLREALDNMDAGEVEDIMNALGAVKWEQEPGDLFREICRNIFLFQYGDAALLLEELLPMLKEQE